MIYFILFDKKSSNFQWSTVFSKIAMIKILSKKICMFKCMGVWRGLNLIMCHITVCTVRIVLLGSAIFVHRAPSHNPCISRTRHLFCYTDRVESQLDSNKIFRARSGSRNLFWLLNNVKTKNKKYCFCLSCRPGPLLKSLVTDKRPRKWNSTLSWWILDKMFY